MSLLSFVEGWSRHEGGVWTAESKARGELLYGRAWCDTESRHARPRCASCKLLPSAPSDEPRGCRARPMYSPVRWSHLHLVLRGFLIKISLPDNNNYYYLLQGGHVLPVICLSVCLISNFM